MMQRTSSVISYCNRYVRVADVEERNRLRNELMKGIICNLIYVDESQRWSDIATYFGTDTGSDASKAIRKNLKVLTDENWGLDPLVKVVVDRYVINDSLGSDLPVKFENGRYVIVINDLRKDD